MCHTMESPQSATVSRSVGRVSLYPRDITQMLLPDSPGDSSGAGGEAGQSWKQASLEVCFLSIVGLPEVIFGRNNTEVGSTDRGLLEM